ncbi:glycosyltransferase family 87 protein [Corynebacterium terpenotabidum]|uniref:Arabinofuranosyltransferase C n=1 Tax=Corynebacterium terpenotabidum Y-11 TaxID=1200352 RepID=S4XJZ5_9CORY|nr:glycosyltransferase family 87 protein [Corynebacterium terpenotabidum]AGP30888.1 arabinofuranosyltransferase C [Corynebacterium terpenotabidum Y-11]
MTATTTTPQFPRILTRAAWPLAIMTLIHRVIISPQNHHPTDDFTTVWTALHQFVSGASVYTDDYTNDDPHYLYSPGGTLLLSPLGALSSGVGRNALILADALAVLLALALLTLLVGRKLTGPVLPVAVFLVFATESVSNTLVFSNINGVLFLLEVAFLWLLLVDRGQAPWNLLRGGETSDADTTTSRIPWAGILAGIALGLAITVKPQFVVLLFLPLVRRQWSTLAAGVAVPVVFTGIGWLLVPDTDTYVNTLIPYLGEVRDYANSAIAGVGAHYGWPAALVLVCQILAAVCVAVAVLGLLWWRNSDPFMWAATTAAVLLTGVFLVSSLGQMYYSMLLVPMIFTVLTRRSVMHGTAIWFGVYFSLSWDEWLSDRWPRAGEIFHYSFGTVGWAIIVLVSAVTVTGWLLERRANGQPVGVPALCRDLLQPVAGRATTGDNDSRNDA